MYFQQLVKERLVPGWVREPLWAQPCVVFGWVVFPHHVTLPFPRGSIAPHVFGVSESPEELHSSHRRPQPQCQSHSNRPQCQPACFVSLRSCCRSPIGHRRRGCERAASQRPLCVGSRLADASHAARERATDAMVARIPHRRVGGRNEPPYSNQIVILHSGQLGG
eukprot:COSAG02_NODE_39_length_48074_cov_106.508890_24_plen_165_part_00